MKKIFILIFTITSFNLWSQCWKSVVTGEFHTLAINSDGTLWGWGKNFVGQLGLGSIITSTNLPTQIGIDNWKCVATSDYHSLAIKNDGTLWVTGYNANGQLGDGTTTDSFVFKQIGTASDWDSVACGYAHSIAIKNDGSIWAWGLNALGQLCDGTTIDKITPIKALNPNNYTKIGAGGNTSMILKSDGSLFLYGAPNMTPNPWLAISNCKSFSCSFGHYLAIKTDGTLWAWGSNSNGQLGDGTNTYTSTPKQIAPLFNNWVSVSVGGQHSIGVKSDGTLWGWGYNGIGQLGDYTTVDKNLPTQISNTITNWSFVSAGANRTYAITSNSNLFGTGDSPLGNGTNQWKNYLVQIACPQIGINEIDKINIRIFPNPTKEKIFIENMNLEGNKYEIYDMTGKLVSSGFIRNNYIDIKELSAGLFSIHIKAGLSAYFSKFIVEH